MTLLNIDNYFQNIISLQNRIQDSSLRGYEYWPTINNQLNERLKNLYEIYQIVLNPDWDGKNLFTNDTIDHNEYDSLVEKHTKRNYILARVSFLLEKEISFLQSIISVGIVPSTNAPMDFQSSKKRKKSNINIQQNSSDSTTHYEAPYPYRTYSNKQTHRPIEVPQARKEGSETPIDIFQNLDGVEPFVSNTTENNYRGVVLSSHTIKSPIIYKPRSRKSFTSLNEKANFKRGREYSYSNEGTKKKKM